MADFSDIGALLGVPAGNELSYQKGLALGANTQNAMQQARERVRKNTAMEQLGGLADELGIPAAYLTAVQAGVDPREITGASNQILEHGLRATASSADPNVDAGARNRALYGVASGPVKPFEAVGSHGYQDILHPELGVMPLGAAAGGGGDAAAIQILQAFGFLDPSGHVTPGRERQAFDVMRTTGKTVDEGGVPGVTDFNPFVPHALGGPMPTPAAAPAGPGNLGAELAPPAPVAAPAPAPAVAGPGAVLPISSATRVASNVAEIEKAKKVGEAAGNNAAALPDALADIDKLEGNVDNLLKMPGFDSVYGHIQGQPVMQTLTGLASQDAANAQAQLKNIDAQTFGIAVQKMRSLGSLSNAEGMKVTDAFTRATNTKISPVEARAAWQEMKTLLNTARLRAQGKTQIPPASTPSGPSAAGPGAYADPAKEARYQAWKAAQGGQ